MSSQQTTRIEAEFRYDQIERPADLPRTQTFAFSTVEKMDERFGKERRRRALADRATSGRYRLILTAYGIEKCERDADAAARHANIGDWITI